MVEFSGSMARGWGIAHQSGAIAISSAEVASILQTLSGLAKALILTAGGLSLGVLAVSAIQSLALSNKARRWNDLVEVKTSGRLFRGIPLESEIAIECEDNIVNVPVELISSYSSEWGTDLRRKNQSIYKLAVKLRDGSSFNGGLIKSHEQLRFLTSVGVQTLRTDSNHKISPRIPAERQAFVSEVGEYLERHALDVEAVLGEGTFSNFFTKRH